MAPPDAATSPRSTALQSPRDARTAAAKRNQTKQPAVFSRFQCVSYVLFPSLSWQNNHIYISVYVNKGGPGSLLLNSTVRYLRAGPRACLRAPLRCTSSRSSQRSAAGRMRPRLALASRRTPLRSSQTSGLQSEMFPEFKFMQSEMVQELNAKRRTHLSSTR